MNCTEFQNILLKYTSGELSAEMNQNIERHLTECSECRKKYTFFVSTLQLLQHERQIVVNPFVETRILEAIKPKQKSKLIAVLKPIFIAATLIISIFIGNIFANVISQHIYVNQTKQFTQNQDTISSFVVNDVSNDYLQFLNNQ